jgi:hypothetical protein
MQTWDNILAAAVIGTEHRQLDIVATESDLQHLLRQLSSTDPETELLSAASIVALYRKAGVTSSTDAHDLPEPAVLEERSRSSHASAQHLALMLSGEYREVLSEWLTLTDNASRRVPEELLPALLDHGSYDASLRAKIIAVLGQRGQWLARQNSDWSYVIQKDEKETWETGGREARLLLLDQLRNSDPAKARILVTSTWAQESARDRAAFLDRFATGLSANDEAFLIEALRDRSAEVRRTARTLLAGFQSEFSRKLRELAHQLFSFRKPLIGKARIEVSLPEDPISWLREHGVEVEAPPKNAVHSLGAQGWALKELISLVPIRFWTETWKRTPGEILNAANDNEWQTAFALGFVGAAGRDREAEWLEALIQFNWSNEKLTQPTELAPYLPLNRLEALILQFLASEKPDLTDEHPALPLLMAHRSPWSDQLSRAVVSSVKKRSGRKKDSVVDWQAKTAFKQFALYVSPSLYDEFVEGWPVESESWSSWSKSFVAFQSLLAFRRDLHNAILEKEQII